MLLTCFARQQQPVSRTEPNFPIELGPDHDPLAGDDEPMIP